MASDPISSALAALVTHLATELGDNATVREGWPEHEVDFDIEAGPVVSVVAGEAPEERCSPQHLSTVEDEDGNMLVTYKVANLSFPVQVDLFTAYKVQRDSLALSVLQALENQVPFSSALWLTHSDYYGRSVTFEITGQDRTQDQAGVERGEWCARFNLRADTVVVTTRTFAKATTLQTTLRTTSLGVVVTDISTT